MLLNTILKYLTTMVDSAVVKYNTKALENETTRSAKVADYYMSAVENTSTFYAYPSFSVEAIVNAGVPTYTVDDFNAKRYTAYTLSQNPNLILPMYHKAIVNEQKKIIIREYEIYGDSNNYYRMLSGLPNLGTTENEFIKLPIEIYSKYDIDTNKYVHQFTDEEIRLVSSEQAYTDMIMSNPDKPYLNFLGDKRISPLKARRANNFSLLYVSSVDVPSTFYDSFTREYERYREYVCTVLYNKHMANSYNLYDNFMAMCIMFMTIQRMITLSFKSGIDRDLYDWDFIQNLYGAYNVPFNESLSIDTHITLLKNLNRLLQYKSTDKVFFDLCSLLGYSNIEFEKYYLIKSHKVDVNGNPIMVYNDDGSLNKSAMYDLYFKTANLTEKNVTLALQNSSSTKTYEEVTESDPFWWDSGDLKNTILEDEFNYCETKYVSLNMMYNMTEIMFDITYAIQTILDQKDNIDTYGITISLPKISLDRKFSLFDVMVFIIAGMSKMNGFKGNIPNKYSEISHIYGFRKDAFNTDNMDAALYAISGGLQGAQTGTASVPLASGSNSANVAWKKRLDWYVYNPSTGTFKKDFPDNDIRYVDLSTGNYVKYDGATTVYWNNIQSADDINKLFNSIQSFRDNIVNAMWETDDINKYTAYRALYDVYLTKSTVDTMFTKSDGSIATTYLDYLSDADIDLYNMINDTEDLYDILSHAVGRLQEEFTEMDHLNLILDDSDAAYKAITSLINFFKSYTIDIHSFNIWYLFDSKYYNSIRLFHSISHVHSEMLAKSELNMIYGDTMNIQSNLNVNDKLNMRETISFIWEK